MPRSTLKSRAKNGNNLKPCQASNNTARKRKNTISERELVMNSPKQTVIEEVFHRKSERRRVARDIFLVFEESKSRKNNRASKKQIKSKFSHLKVEPIRPKGLLRDIKNEPKSFLNGSNVNVTLPNDVSILKSCTNVFSVRKEEKDVKSEMLKTSIRETVKLGYLKKTNNIKSIKISTLESQPCKLRNESKLIARVNPIFLWVKQDDTRIVEVRCEDYDKRNRIRITKTSNGWRAIPRSDPTTSRILKFYPTSLMTVKRENCIHEPNNIIDSKNDFKDIVVSKNFPTTNILSEGIAKKNDTNLNEIDTSNPVTIKDVKLKTKNKKSKKLKKKSHTKRTLKKYKTSDTSERSTVVNTETLTQFNSCFNEHSSDVMDFSVQINSGLGSKINEPGSCLYTDDIDENVPVNTIKKNFEDLENNSNSINAPFNIDIPPKKKPTYQKESEKEFSYHLCSKTGLFLPSQISFSEYENESNEISKDQNKSRTTKNSTLNSNKEIFVIDIGKINEESKIQIPEETAESLEAKTKNLKDLLDDADLLQNCDENINIDAELIDTIVKNSCESNLIPVSELVTKTNMDQLNQKTSHGSNEIVLQILSEVSDPPKCLSFNEAGEIEGLNGELFQSNTFIETFDKESSSILAEPHVMLHSTTNVTETPLNPQKNSSCENIEHIVEIFDSNSKLHSLNEDSPKDLSYKKREEVCPPSESRSQCAVTSSSDVVKSPHEETSSLASSSETLKTLILEQFMKLNALTTQHQRDTIDVEKQRSCDTSNIKALYSSKFAHSSNFIETVIIEDDDNEIEEPLKKRIRLSKQKRVIEKVGKLAMIDKDPDPLTQLRLLISNTQWKVPDPILVPKERLSAVLASPAREIPLLITTRPELRLPEAFAYPEIIQNPNILVISMAQLEAILKNELKMERNTTFKSMNPDVNQQLSGAPDVQFANFASGLQSESCRHQQSSKQSSNFSSQVEKDINLNHTDVSDSSKTRQEYDKTQQMNLSLTSELSSTTIEMLKQLLWLPYFGQIPQDIVNCVKNSKGLNSQINGITDLNDIVKNTDINNQTIGHSISNIGFESFQQQFKTNEELSLFKKIVQHQMQSVFQLNQLKVDSPKVTAPEALENSASLIDRTKSKIEPLSQIKIISNKQANTSMFKNQTTISSNNISVPEKSYNLRSSVAGRHSLESKQYSNNNQRQIAHNKPRLTCKSLSNLLNPEHNTVPSSDSSIPYAQNEFLKSFKEIKRSSVESRMSESSAEGKRQFLSNATMVSPCGNFNVSIESSSGLTNQKPNLFETNSANNEAPGLTADTNIPLWHPLFGR